MFVTVARMLPAVARIKLTVARMLVTVTRIELTVARMLPAVARILVTGTRIELTGARMLFKEAKMWFWRRDSYGMTKGVRIYKEGEKIKVTSGECNFEFWARLRIAGSSLISTIRLGW